VPVVNSYAHRFLLLFLVGVCSLFSAFTTTSSLPQAPVLPPITELCEQPILELLPEFSSIQTHGSITLDAGTIASECQPVVYVNREVVEKPLTATELISSVLSFPVPPTYTCKITAEEAPEVEDYTHENVQERFRFYVNGNLDDNEGVYHAPNLRVGSFPVHRHFSGDLVTTGLSPNETYTVDIFPESIPNPLLYPVMGYRFAFIAQAGRTREIDIALQPVSLGDRLDHGLGRCQRSLASSYLFGNDHAGVRCLSRRRVFCATPVRHLHARGTQSTYG